MSAARPPVFNAPPATLLLCGALIAAHAAARVFGGGAMGWDGWILDSANPWAPALAGHVFMHAGATHLLANAGMTLAFGSVVERRFGAAGLIGIFAVSALAGALGFVAAVDFAGGAARLAGASGAVHGALGAAALILWRSGRPAPRRLGAALVGFAVAVNLAIAALGDTGGLFGFRIAWHAHLAGLAAGLAIAALLSRRRW